MTIFPILLKRKDTIYKAYFSVNYIGDYKKILKNVDPNISQKFVFL
jgi:hypothetical protein